MEGVTDPVFRRLVLSRNPPSALGGVFTEFLRVSAAPIRSGRILAHLGPASGPSVEGVRAVVGLQLLGSDPGAVAETARRAEGVGAPIVDLNFGCPAKGALRSCAGSAMLDRPEAIEDLVGRCVAEVDRIPISAKIRSGGEDDRALEEIALAVQEGGASLLSVHCRTRAEGYRGPGDWERIARAVQAVDIPVCGNGGVESHFDIERLRRRTGCEYVMVGRAALANPWVFLDREVGREEAAGFLLEYALRLGEERGAAAMKVLGRIKQLLRVWEAGELVSKDRGKWLGERSLDVILDRLRAEARA